MSMTLPNDGAQGTALAKTYRATRATRPGVLKHGGGE